MGIGKSRYMAAEHGEALDVMRSVKQTLDPNGILNPGKIFPEAVGENHVDRLRLSLL